MSTATKSKVKPTSKAYVEMGKRFRKTRSKLLVTMPGYVNPMTWLGNELIKAGAGSKQVRNYLRSNMLPKHYEVVIDEIIGALEDQGFRQYETPKAIKECLRKAQPLLKAGP